MKRLVFNELIEWKNKKDRKPLVLHGARQVGKTWLLQEFGKEYFNKVHYFNFERNPLLGEMFAKELSPKRILALLSVYLETSIDKDDLIIFDEIQSSPIALTSLKYFCEELPEFYVVSAGSLLGLQLNSASYPVGKIDTITLYPLCFEEFLNATSENFLLEELKLTCSTPITDSFNFPHILHDKAWNCFLHYLIVGGMPEAILKYLKYKDNLAKAFTEVRNTQNNLLTAYVADMAKHSGKINAMHIERVLNSIPNQIMSSIDEKLPKYVFKDVVPGNRGFERLAPAIDWLIKAGLGVKTPIINRAEAPLLAYQSENIFKLSLFDVGLLGAITMLPFSQILSYSFGSYKGYFAESFVLQELRSKGHSLVSWREGIAEVEFITYNQKGNVIPIEVKAGNLTKAKSLHMFNTKYSPEYSLVLSGRLEEQNKTQYCKRPIYTARFLNLS